MRVRLYTTRINGDGFDLRRRPGVPTIHSLYPGPLPCSIIAGIYTGSLPCSIIAGIYTGCLPSSVIAGIYTGFLPCSIIAGIYSGPLPRSVITGICSGSFPCSVTDRASRCRCALRYQPTFGHLPAMPQYSDISSTSAADSMPYFAPRS